MTTVDEKVAAQQAKVAAQVAAVEREEDALTAQMLDAIGGIGRMVASLERALDRYGKASVLMDEDGAATMAGDLAALVRAMKRRLAVATHTSREEGIQWAVGELAMHYGANRLIEGVAAHLRERAKDEVARNAAFSNLPEPAVSMPARYETLADEADILSEKLFDAMRRQR